MPTLPPERFSRIGRTTSSVVPGWVVDWSTISIPGLMFEPTDSAADTMKLRSGVRVFESGVGTQIVRASSSVTAA